MLHYSGGREGAEKYKYNHGKTIKLKCFLFKHQGQIGHTQKEMMWLITKLLITSYLSDNITMSEICIKITLTVTILLNNAHVRQIIGRKKRNVKLQM